MLHVEKSRLYGPESLDNTSARSLASIESHFSHGDASWAVWHQDGNHGTIRNKPWATVWSHASGHSNVQTMVKGIQTMRQFILLMIWECYGREGNVESRRRESPPGPSRRHQNVLPQKRGHVQGAFRVELIQGPTLTQQFSLLSQLLSPMCGLSGSSVKD
jgi:hypothetical protein